MKVIKKTARAGEKLANYLHGNLVDCPEDALIFPSNTAVYVLVEVQAGESSVDFDKRIQPIAVGDESWQHLVFSRDVELGYADYSDVEVPF